MRQCFFIIKACKLSVVLFFIISIIWVFIFKWIVSRDFRGLQMIQWTEHKRLVLAVLQYIGYGCTRITKYFYFYKHFYQGDVPPSNVQKKQSEFCYKKTEPVTAGGMSIQYICPVFVYFYPLLQP